MRIPTGGISRRRSILSSASGERIKGEELGLGDYEFVPWPIGITG